MTGNTARVSAREEFDRCTGLFGGMSAHSGVVFWVASADFSELTYISPGCVEIWGRKREELYADPKVFFDAANPALSTESKEISQEISAGKKFTADYRITRPDGSVRWVMLNAFPVEDPGSAGKRMAGIAEDVTDRKNAETTLRESAENTQDMYNNAPCGFHSIDCDGTFIQMNDTELGWLGYTREEVIGKMNISNVQTSESFDIFQKNFPQFKKRGWVKDVEAEFIRKDGSTFYAIINATAIKDENGNYIKSRSTVYDSTKLKQIDKDLRASREAFKALLNAITESAFLIDVSGNVITANATTAERLNMTLDKLIGSNVYAILPPDIARSRMKKVAEVIKTRQPVHFEDCRNGRYLDQTIYPYNDENGKLNKLAIFATDVTIRKNAEHELFESRETLKALLNAITESAYLIDLDGRVIEANETVANRLFTDLAHLVGGNIYDFLEPDASARRKRKADEAVKTGQPVHFEDYRGERCFDVTIYPIADESGTVTRLAIFAHDITRLKKLATTDILTGAYNRTKLDEVMDIELKRASRYKRQLSVIMLDIDHFKLINDNHGHLAGDGILRGLLELVRSYVRETHYIFRWGGEEFIILMPEADIKGAAVLAERLRQAIEAHVFEGGLRITSSFGVAEFISDDTEDTLIHKADTALYAAKEKGRNRVEPHY